MMDLQEEKTHLMSDHGTTSPSSSHISDHIGVMYLGKLVEKCENAGAFQNQLHLDTKALLSASPRIDIDNPSKRTILRGEITFAHRPGSPAAACSTLPVRNKGLLRVDPEAARVSRPVTSPRARVGGDPERHGGGRPRISLRLVRSDIE